MQKFYYGGQAVIEGVMMRGRAQATVVMRKPDGELISRTLELPSMARATLARIPLARGLIVLIEMLVVGTKVMLLSANVQARNELGAEIPRRLLVIMLAISLTFAIGLFFLLPLALARGSGSGHGAIVLEGVLRLAIFIGYLVLIGRLDRMRRVFEYHGAEHKTINAFEAGAPLSPASVQAFSTIHVRCGTAFLLWVAVVSIFVFALLGHPPLVIGIIERIALVPVIAAVSYEILRLGARFYWLLPVRAAMQPGLWLQRLTTREPSDDQVAVAIAALLPVLEADGVFAGSLQAAPSPA